MNIGNIEAYGIVYKITNNINNKVYIGVTVQERGFKDRYGGNLERNTHNKYLKYSINKYGISNFTITEILDIAFSYEELNIKEKTWISIYKSNNKLYGYNLTDGGSNGKLNSCVKERMSLNNKGSNNPMYGKTHSEEAKQKIGLANRGRTINFSKEHNAKLSEVMKGKKFTEEHRRNLKLSHINKNLGGDNPNAKQRVIKFVNKEPIFFGSCVEAVDYMTVLGYRAVKKWFRKDFGIPKKHQDTVEFVGYVQEYYDYKNSLIED